MADVNDRNFGRRIKDFLEWRYRTSLRPYFPRREGTYNGVQVRAGRLFDDLIPFDLGHPNPALYEGAIISALQNHVAPGDSVVIVGGGLGVSSVVAARCTGPTGSVLVFEGSKEYISRVRETADLNDVSEVVRVEHAVVGEAIRLRGEQGEADVVSPSDLPECEVLELDCEGVELDILDALPFRPRVIIVESHGFLGAPTDEVRSMLENQSYRIVNESIADLGQKEECIEGDIRVLVAIRP